MKEQLQKRILIVDDNESYCELLVVLLDDEGYKTETVYDGSSALTCLATHEYDILLADLYLPDIRGDQLITHTRQNHPTIHTMLMSTHPCIEQFAQACGAEKFYVKGNSTGQLCEQLQNLLS